MFKVQCDSTTVHMGTACCGLRMRNELFPTVEFDVGAKKLRLFACFPPKSWQIQFLRFRFFRCEYFWLPFVFAYYCKRNIFGVGQNKTATVWELRDIFHRPLIILNQSVYWLNKKLQRTQSSFVHCLNGNTCEISVFH